MAEDRMSPEKLGRFTIEKELGRSDLVTVYKANDPRFERTVVLRTMSVDVPGPQAAVRLARFREEAERAAKLDSPNIASVYECGEVDGKFYVASEYVVGQNFHELIQKKRSFGAGDLLDISRQICTAFDHAQSRRVVAANIKPANFVLEEDGNVKIMDFGITETTGHAAEALHYISPEQARGEKLDVRSNLFSWAAVLYEVTSGQKAFSGTNVEAVRRAVLEHMPPSPDAGEKKVHAGIARVIMKALAKAREQRYAQGADFVRDMEDFKNFARSQESLTMPFGVAVPPRPAPQPVVPEPAAPKPSPRVAAAKLAGKPAPIKSAPPSPRPTMSSATTVATPVTVPLEKTVPVKSAPQPINPATTAKVTQPFAPTRTAASDNRPSIFRDTQQLRLMMYGMAAVIVTLLAVILFSAVRASHMPPPGVPPASQVASDPAFSPPNSAPPPAETKPATDNRIAFEINKPPAKPAREALHPRHVANQVKSQIPMTGGLAVSSTPSGAQVELDGHNVASCITPCVLNEVSAGQHTVAVSKYGYVVASRSVSVLGGGHFDVSLAMTAAGGSLLVASEPPGASISIDGHSTGRVTPAQLVLGQGHHKVLVEKAGFLPAAATADVAAGQTFHFSPALKVAGNVDDIRTAGKFGRIFHHGAEGMGKVQIRSNPKGAQILINGRVFDKPTPADFYLDPGSYEINLSLPGYKVVRRVITVERGQKLLVDEGLQP